MFVSTTIVEQYSTWQPGQTIIGIWPLIRLFALYFQGAPAGYTWKDDIFLYFVNLGRPQLIFYFESERVLAKLSSLTPSSLLNGIP